MREKTRGSPIHPKLRFNKNKRYYSYQNVWSIFFGPGSCAYLRLSKVYFSDLVKLDLLNSPKIHLSAQHIMASFFVKYLWGGSFQRGPDLFLSWEPSSESILLQKIPQNISALCRKKLSFLLYWRQKIYHKQKTSIPVFLKFNYFRQSKFWKLILFQNCICVFLNFVGGTIS